MLIWAAACIVIAAEISRQIIDELWYVLGQRVQHWHSSEETEVMSFV